MLDEVIFAYLFDGVPQTAARSSSCLGAGLEVRDIIERCQSCSCT